MTRTMLVQLDRIRSKNPHAYADLIDHIGDLVAKARSEKK